MQRVLIPGAAALLAVAAAPQQFVELPKAHLPAIGEGADIVATGDVDGDGDVDLVVDRQFHSRVTVWFNDGAGRFTGSTTEANAGAGGGGVLADLDGDGDLDLAWENTVFLNDGTGTFTTSSRLQVAEAHAVAVGDVDGDGDQDLAIAVGGNPGGARNALFLNDGSAHFTDASARLPLSSTDSRAIAFGDVDHDGDLDLVVGNLWQTAYGTDGAHDELYLNDGHGVFTDASSQLVQVLDITEAVALVDVDGDGDPDLVSACDGSRVDLNDGSGHFTRAPAALPSFDADVLACGDVEGDGDVDLLFPGALYLNDGSGSFVDASGMLPRSAHLATSAVLADLDGDGDLDIATGREPGAQLYLNGGGAFFDGSACHLPVDWPESDPSLALGDLDGDGDLDIVEHGRICDNDGRGWFTERPFAGINGRLASGDVDADGDLDLLIFSQYVAGRNGLYLNDGHGVFTPAPGSFPPIAGPALSAAFGDVDADGDLDLAMTTTGPSVLLINDGDGVFTDETVSRLPDDPRSAANAAFGDIDADGDLDLVLGGWNSRLYLNDGTGVFADVSASQLPGGPADTKVFLGDVDVDGDLDILCANSGQDRQNRLYLNDGRGWFTDVTATHMPVDDGNTVMIAIADFDDDGDLDLYCANGLQYDREPNRLWLNDGGGRFVDASERLASDVAVTVAVAAGDVDGDGDVDIVCAEPYPSWDRLWLNLLRQLDAPYLLVAGRTWTLDVHARPGFSPLFQLVMPIVSAGSGNVPLPPFGTFGLDPTRMVELPWLYVAPPGGKASTVIPVPPDPSLAGVQVFAQAVTMSPVDPARFTNVIGDRALR